MLEPKTIKLTDTTEVVAPINKEHKYIGSIPYKPGMQYWQLNTNTFELKKLDITSAVHLKLLNPKKADAKTQETKEHKTIVSDESVIIVSLNEKNAQRKAIKIMCKLKGINPQVIEQMFYAPKKIKL